jgi:hypothetical protein
VRSSVNPSRKLPKDYLKLIITAHFKLFTYTQRKIFPFHLIINKVLLVETASLNYLKNVMSSFFIRNFLICFSFPLLPFTFVLSATLF